MLKNRIYFNLLKTRVHLLYGCTFFFIVAMISIWWWCWYGPLVSINRRLDHDCSKLFSQSFLNKEHAKRAAEIQKRFADLALDSQKNSKKRDDALCALVGVAQKNGLAIQSAKFCRQKNTSWCTKQELQLESRGTLDQLIAFFDALSNTKPLTNCKQIQLLRLDKETISLRATFVTYLI